MKAAKKDAPDAPLKRKNRWSKTRHKRGERDGGPLVDLVLTMD